MDVEITHIFPEYPSRMHIQWDITDTGEHDQLSPTFEIQRSGSPGGDWNTLASNITGNAYTDDLSNESNDVSINQLSIDRGIFYRVKMTLSDNRVFTSDPVDNENNTIYDVNHEAGIGYSVDQKRIHPNPKSDFDERKQPRERIHRIDRALQRRYIVDLRELNGVECLILKQKHFGTRCTECFEETTETVLTTDCENCYGTGWDGGYFPPIKTYCKIVESQVQAQVGSRGKTEQQNARINMLNFPRVEEEDVIVKTDTNDRYDIKSVKDKKIRQRTIKQSVTATKLARTSIKYKAPIKNTSIGIPHDN